MTQNTEHINELIVSLCDYAEERGLITRDDRVFAANAICEDMHVSSFSDIPVQPAGAEAPEVRLERILIALCDEAVAAGIISDTSSSRDNFDTRLMGHLTPRPSEVSRRFADDRRTLPPIIFTAPRGIPTTYAPRVWRAICAGACPPSTATLTFP